MSTSSPRRALAAAITSGLFGLVFGLGLIVSHMVDPQRVADFLDVAGSWDPALAFVMGGAILVAMPAFAYARRHRRSALNGGIDLPDRFRINLRLVGGAAIFGLGWGLGGICPGPGLTLLPSLEPHALVFVAAMVAGILLTDIVSAARPATKDRETILGNPAD